jgi:hypothetical protein
LLLLPAAAAVTQEVQGTLLLLPLLSHQPRSH